MESGVGTNGRILATAWFSVTYRLVLGGCEAQGCLVSSPALVQYGIAESSLVPRSIVTVVSAPLMPMVPALSWAVSLMLAQSAVATTPDRAACRALFERLRSCAKSTP